MNFCHVTISVKNLEDSLKFYHEILGLPIKNSFPAGNDSKIVFLGDGDTLVELIYDKANDNTSFGKDISIGFSVDSLEKTIDLLQKNKIAAGKIIQPNPGVKFFFVSDPNGLKVQFVEYVKK